LLIFGAFFSALAGNGDENSNKTNVRTTQAARTVCRKKSFFGGTVMGLGVAGLAF
jgi:Na+/H+-translocating membrane pyrophosphatase